MKRFFAEDVECEVEDMLPSSITIKATIIFRDISIDLSFQTTNSTSGGDDTPVTLHELQTILQKNPSAFFGEQFLQTFGEPLNATNIQVIYPSPLSPPTQPPLIKQPPPSSPPPEKPKPPPSPPPNPFAVEITLVFSGTPRAKRPSRRMLQLPAEGLVVTLVEDAIKEYAAYYAQSDANKYPLETYDPSHVLIRNTRHLINKESSQIRIYVEIHTPDEVVKNWCDASLEAQRTKPAIQQSYSP